MSRLSIATSVRIKPLHSDEQVPLDISQSTLVSPFTTVLDSKQTQLKAYTSTSRDAINAFTNGKNCTLFVYGQTGSGKTHTMFGPPNAFNKSSLDHTNEEFCGTQIPSTWGIFPRLVVELLKDASSVTASAVEIYMDNCYDLMRPSKPKIPVAGFGKSQKITGRGSYVDTTTTARDSSGKWIPPPITTKKLKSDSYELQGAKPVVMANVKDLLDFMCSVESCRTSKSHKLNDRSSRSHCVITLTMPQKTQKKFMLVDLAGSERIMKSGSVEECTKAAEAKNINTSLTSLGRCITALHKKNSFVPYRDSVLTMLLKQSLGGSCCTSIIITVAEDIEMQSETMASIQFGSRCTRVSTKKQKPEVVDMQEIIREHWAELHQLDIDIKRMEDDNTAGVGLDMTAPHSLRQSFMCNLEKYKMHLTKMNNAKERIRAGEEGLEQTVTFEQSQVKNLQGIVLRSMTTGIWKDPTSSYVKKVQRRDIVLAVLKGLGEDIDDVKDINLPLTFEQLLRGYTG